MEGEVTYKNTSKQNLDGKKDVVEQKAKISSKSI